MKKVLSVILALAMAFAAACAEEKATCTYTLYNVTGETITELYVTDNNTGVKSGNLAGEEGMKNQTSLEVTGENYDGYEVTLSFVTESGYKAEFKTLHFEDAPIALLPAPAEGDADSTGKTDAVSGATPIQFGIPNYQASYELINQTGEPVIEVTLTNNVDGRILYAYVNGGEPLEKDGSLLVTISEPADKTGKEDIEMTLQFTTASGYEAAFKTLHFETVKINLLAPDALTGATPISFGF